MKKKFNSVIFAFVILCILVPFILTGASYINIKTDYGIIILKLINYIIIAIEVIIPVIVLVEFCSGKKGKKITYCNKIPKEDATPTIVDKIMKVYSEIDNFGKVFSATILDLNLKGFLKFEINNEFNSKLDDKKLIIFRGNNVDKDKLKYDEKKILEFINDAINENNGKMSVYDLNCYIINNNSKASDLKNNVIEYEDIFTIKENYTNKKSEKTLLILSFMIFSIIPLSILFAGMSSILKVTNLYVESSFLKYISIFMYICYCINFIMNRFNPNVMEEKENWDGLKNYTMNFYNMDKTEQASLTEWRKIVPYTILFNTNKNLIEHLKSVYPEYENDEYFGSDYFEPFFSEMSDLSFYYQTLFDEKKKIKSEDKEKSDLE